MAKGAAQVLFGFHAVGMVVFIPLILWDPARFVELIQQLATWIGDEQPLPVLDPMLLRHLACYMLVLLFVCFKGSESSDADEIRLCGRILMIADTLISIVSCVTWYSSYRSPLILSDAVGGALLAFLWTYALYCPRSKDELGSKRRSAPRKQVANQVPEPVDDDEADDDGDDYVDDGSDAADVSDSDSGSDEESDDAEEDVTNSGSQWNGKAGTPVRRSSARLRAKTPVRS